MMSRALRRLRELGFVTYRQGYGYFLSHPRLRIVGPVPWRSTRHDHLIM
jgi:DNA-binding transcriptional regulator YhcF (GntR family)